METAVDAYIETDAHFADRMYKYELAISLGMTAKKPVRINRPASAERVANHPRLSEDERQQLEAAMGMHTKPMSEAQLTDFERGRAAFAGLKGK